MGHCAAWCCIIFIGTISIYLNQGFYIIYKTLTKQQNQLSAVKDRPATFKKKKNVMASSTR